MTQGLFEKRPVGDLTLGQEIWADGLVKVTSIELIEHGLWQVRTLREYSGVVRTFTAAPAELVPVLRT